jgi:hypothetical protein
MNRRWSLNKKQNKIVYNILNINENTKDKVCISADNDNEKKYQAVMKKAGKTSKLWDHTGVTMNIDVPNPPKPTNYDRLLDFRKKNVLRSSIHQSKATLYLYKNGYKLGKDYQAFQAIEIYDKLIAISRNEKKINKIKKEENIQNNFKDLSLIDKIPKSKNIYPNLSISPENKNVKKIEFGWERKQISLPNITDPEPSAPPSPNSFNKKFSEIENSSSEDDDYQYSC